MNEKLIKENVICTFERNLNVRMSVQSCDFLYNSTFDCDAMYFGKYNKVFIFYNLLYIQMKQDENDKLRSQ